MDRIDDFMHDEFSTLSNKHKLDAIRKYVLDIVNNDEVPDPILRQRLKYLAYLLSGIYSEVGKNFGKAMDMVLDDHAAIRFKKRMEKSAPDKVKSMDEINYYIDHFEIRHGFSYFKFIEFISLAYIAEFGNYDANIVTKIKPFTFPHPLSRGFFFLTCAILISAIIFVVLNFIGVFKCV